MGALPFEEEVIARADQLSAGPNLTIPVASAEDLVIMTLVAARPRDLDDVRALLELYPDLGRARIRRIVTEYANVLEHQAIVDGMNRALS
jgi:hypothetical protein